VGCAEEVGVGEGGELAREDIEGESVGSVFISFSKASLTSPKSSFPLIVSLTSSKSSSKPECSMASDGVFMA